PETYRGACNAMDEVWVPSRFNMETFANGGVEKRKLRLVPGGVDTKTFCPGAAPLEIPRKRRFNFLSVFDWHRRKGYDVLLRAYLREFTSDDDVTLILKVYQLVAEFSDLEAKISHFIERVTGLPMEIAPPIILINGFVPQRDMARLYATADAFVLPSRGEAYGRPYLEAMACRLPVVATKWSGQLDFLNNQNSYLIESQLTPVPPDVEIEEYKGHLWAEPSADHLRELMRDVYSHPEKARKKAEQGRKDVVQNYDWSVVTPRWVNEFERLLSGRRLCAAGALECGNLLPL
ncbi:MAG: glycosyltransferase, partial [Terriglobia bacterium]